jgi:hypothetical protein
LSSFKFVFILYLMFEIMVITNILKMWCILFLLQNHFFNNSEIMDDLIF